MPNLNKRQIEFRKQMQQLEKDKTYKEIMNDHDSFYNNKAYELELEELKIKKKKANRKFIYFLIIFCIGIITYKNLDIIKSKLATYIENKSFNEAPIKIINNNIFTDNEINQYKVGKYHNNYGNRVEIIQTIHSTILNPDNYYNYNIDKINEELVVINSMINEFNNYVPEELFKNLHDLNLNILNSLNIKYNSALLLSENYYNQEQIYIFNNENDTLNKLYNDYRIELIRIFNNIKMSYEILENGAINFNYKNINDQ